MEEKPVRTNSTCSAIIQMTCSQTIAFITFKNFFKAKSILNMVSNSMPQSDIHPYVFFYFKNETFGLIFLNDKDFGIMMVELSIHIN